MRLEQSRTHGQSLLPPDDQEAAGNQKFLQPAVDALMHLRAHLAETGPPNVPDGDKSCYDDVN